MKLTIGTITRPANMAMAPLLIGDFMIAGKYGRKNMFKIMRRDPNVKLT